MMSPRSRGMIAPASPGRRKSDITSFSMSSPLRRPRPYPALVRGPAVPPALATRSHAHRAGSVDA